MFSLKLFSVFLSHFLHFPFPFNFLAYSTFLHIIFNFSYKLFPCCFLFFCLSFSLNCVYQTFCFLSIKFYLFFLLSVFLFGFCFIVLFSVCLFFVFYVYFDFIQLGKVNFKSLLFFFLNCSS